MASRFGMLLLGLVTFIAIALPCSAESRYAVVIHAGAGGWPGVGLQHANEIEQALESALRKAQQRLAAGGSALDAVELAINTLEDCPRFNAGKGAVFNAAGQHQLDASIMNGADRSAGAVAAIGVAKNPISVARLVMSNTRHVLLAGEGANAFARQQNAKVVDPEYFWTEQLRVEWRDQQQSQTSETPPHHYGTVGCVALDGDGNLAAGTSTGGLSGKMVGRVGDSPIIAAGTYADNATCGVSCTGVGELFIRNAIAYDISARIGYAKQSLADAISYHLDEKLDKGTGGIIAIDRDANVVMHFNTRTMPRGVATSDGRFEILFEREGEAK